MRRNELPDTCFSVLPSTGQLIIIKKSESGYYPSEWDTGNREENRDIASSHNARRGITDIQEAAMLAGSMFGWNTPGANPQWYLDNARYVNSNIVQGHIKDPIMSVYYPVSSFLCSCWPAPCGSAREMSDSTHRRVRPQAALRRSRSRWAGTQMFTLWTITRA